MKTATARPKPICCNGLDLFLIGLRAKAQGLDDSMLGAETDQRLICTCQRIPS